MDGLTQRLHQERARVEDALRTYPLAEAPADLAGRVMERVRAESPAPRFRVTWLDTLISLVVPGAGMLLLFTWASLPPQAVAYLQTRTVLLWQFLQRVQLGWVVPATGLLIVGIFTAMTFRLVRPAFRRARIVRMMH